jgi:hypothetical protein
MARNSRLKSLIVSPNKMEELLNESSIKRKSCMVSNDDVKINEEFDKEKMVSEMDMLIQKIIQETYTLYIFILFIF